MTKEEIAGVLEQIATLLELKDENPFKIRAYTNAARSIETFGANVPNLQDEEAVEKIPGHWKEHRAKIKELARNRLAQIFPGIEARNFPGNSGIVFTSRARREKDQSALRKARGQFDRAVAKGMRQRARRGIAGFRRNNTGKAL